MALLKELTRSFLAEAMKISFLTERKQNKPQVNNLRYIINTTFPKVAFDSIRS